MLSIERARQIINDSSLSDQEVEDIRDYFHGLAELIFEGWQEKREKEKLRAIPSNNINNL